MAMGRGRLCWSMVSRVEIGRIYILLFDAVDAQMSHLISTRRVASNGFLATPPPLPSTRSSPTIVDPHMAASGGPDVAQAPASSMFSVALPPSAHRTHQCAWPPDMASTSDTTDLGKITKSI
ncbi:hypothetical protein DVH24_030518 [Malus domestica]|uniref:Uncharacterized protein n=1 Tax=Malus domestica TaxID=3750 RepID=A0A498JYH9_MALDO|nr:hypothetical protein DVH24_030518 [Malus domestica]